MKKNLITIIVMALMAMTANAQTVVAEIDWTQRSEYLDLWYSDLATVTVKQGTGLIIDCTSDGTGNYWQPQVPMIGHIAKITGGGQYQVKFTVDAPAAGEIRLDLCSWDGTGATHSKIIEVTAGEAEYTIDFEDYPTECTDAMIFYQCGKIPGRHIIKKVQVLDLENKIGQTFKVHGFYYKIGDYYTVSVTSGEDAKYNGDIVIPSQVTYNGTTYSVTSIDNSAFSNCIGLTSIIIPSSVTSIGMWAFYKCTGLTSIEIPNSVTSIDVGAFAETPWYNNQPDGLVYAGKVAYKYKGKMPDNTHITIKDGTLGIAGQAFSDCNGLTSINIPSSVIKINLQIFDRCGNLCSIIVENGNSVYDSRNNCNAIINTNDNLLITGCKNTIIPNSVTSIGYMAFENCSGLTSITIPYSVTSIGDRAFYNCTGLTSIAIPSGVTSIYECTFCGCRGLTSIIIPNTVTTIGMEAFLGCTSLTSITIPNSVTHIFPYAFADCSNLTTVISEIAPPFDIIKVFKGIPSDAQLIVPKGTKAKYQATEGWNQFTNIIEPGDVGYRFEVDGIHYEIGENNTVSVIGQPYKYHGDIVIPNQVTYLGTTYKVTSIGHNAFWDCSSLLSITIPNSVTSIGYEAFDGCLSLLTIISEIENPFPYNSVDNVFYFITYDSAQLIVPKGTKAKYQATEGWNQFANIVEADEVGKIFEVNGFYFKISNDNTVSVTTGEGANYFGNLVIPSEVSYDGIEYSVTSIEEVTFHRNSTITSVTIPNTVISIGESAFGACSSLTSVSIPNSVTEIGDAAFYGCTSLESINLPENIHKLGDNLFWGCTKLTDVTIPQSVTTIGKESFLECLALSSITIPDGVTEIGKSAFEKCSSLKVIIIGSRVVSIGSYAFANLNGERTRANNDNLKVYCKAETVPETDENAFDGTPTELSTLYVPASAIEKYRAAWPWSDFKEIVSLDNPSIPDNPVSSSFTEKGINYVVKDDGTLEVTGIEDGTTIVDILSDVYIDGKAYQVTSIGERAFEGRSDIEYLSIPWSVTSIGEYAFIDCGSSNMAVNIADPESWCQMKLGNEHSSPLSCAGKMLVHDIETTSISIPESVTSIGAFTFYQCSCIQSLYIPGSVTSIGSSAFEDCDYLTSLTLNDGLQKIGGSSFQGCTRLQTLTIPSTVKSIKLNAFADCRGITDVYCYADIVPETDDIAFHGTPTEKSTLHVPANAIEAYRTTWPWSDFKEIVALDADGIAIVKSGDGNNMDSDARIYDLQGNRQNTLQKGVNIIKMNNGKVKKVLVK